MNGLSPSDPNTFLQCLLALFTEEWFDVPISSSTILVFSVLITHLFALGRCLLHSLFPDMTIWFLVLSHSESLLFPALILLPAACLVDDFTHFSWGFPATNLFLLFFFDQNLLSNTEEKLKNSSFDNFTLSKWVKVYHNGW